MSSFFHNCTLRIGKAKKLMASSTKPRGVSGRLRGRPRNVAPTGSPQKIKSLDRAMQVFEHLSTVSHGLTLSELAHDTKQSPATVYRILITLEMRGFVEFDAVEQMWNVGARAFTVGVRFLRRSGLVERARPILRQLMEETGETANIGIEKNGMILYLSQVESEQKIRAHFPQGTLSPMHVSGIGKILLSHMDSERLQRWQVRQEFQTLTENSIDQMDDLLAELTITQERGYAIDDEENSLGMRCFAAPVFDINGEAIAGISVSGPTSRVTPDRDAALGRSVSLAAAALTEAIGGTLCIKQGAG